MIKLNYLVLSLVLISSSFAFIYRGVKVSLKVKDEALQMEKEGWTPCPGFPSIEVQLDSFYQASILKDKSNTRVWLMVEGSDSGEVEKVDKYVDKTEGAMNAAYRNLADRLEEYIESAPACKQRELATTDLNGIDTVRTIASGTVYVQKGGIKLVKTYGYKFTYSASANHAPNSKMLIDKSAITTAYIDMNSIKTFVKVTRTVHNKMEAWVKIGYNLNLVSDETDSTKNLSLQRDSIKRNKFDQFLEGR